VDGDSGIRPAVFLAVLGALVLGLVVSLPARAELSQHGDLFVNFEGGLSPSALPRTSLAPIGVRVAGEVRTLSGERPPALRQIQIALNRGGHIDSRGLPLCELRELEASSNAQALANCGGALVGRGSYRAKTAFPEQLTFPSDGTILAFNGRLHGQQVILGHIYGTKPVPISRIIIFHIRHSGGTFGTTITGDLSPSLNRYGYVKGLDLSLHRVYDYHGETRGYISAACSAPAGLGGAVFPFARASMTFADGRRLSSVLTRSCKVRSP
jgi:hypothetical protein